MQQCATLTTASSGAHTPLLRPSQWPMDGVERAFVLRRASGAAEVLRLEEPGTADHQQSSGVLRRLEGSGFVDVGRWHAEARALLGTDAIVGVTCKASRHLAIEAAEAGADYVAFGAFFGSTTKETSVQATPEILEWWSETTSVPCVAIGGITSENCGPLVTAGADFLAVISAIWAHPSGSLTAMANFKSAIEAAQR